MTTPQSIKRVVQLMGERLGLPERSYKPVIYLFARKLPPEAVLEAAEIALAKIPLGGREALRYFCGICNNMIKEQQIWDTIQASPESL